jgi:hypothetical protein
MRAILPLVVETVDGIISVLKVPNSRPCPAEESNVKSPGPDQQRIKTPLKYGKRNSDVGFGTLLVR